MYLGNNELKCFISYSHKDKKMCEEFRTHVDVLNRTYNITQWYDGMIPAGGEIDDEIVKNLNDSDIVFLLISTNYIRSNFCYEKELAIAISRHRNNECIVIPVILRQFLQGEYPFSKLKYVPTDGRPVAKFKSHNDGFVDAFIGIKNLVNKYLTPQKKVSDELELLHSKRKVKKNKTNSDNNKIIRYDIIRDGKHSKKQLKSDTFEVIKLYVEDIVQFKADITNLSNSQLSGFINSISDKTPEAILLARGKNNFESYLLQLFSYIQQTLIGVDGTYVHFRYAKNGSYNTFLQVGYPYIGLSTNPISTPNSMIELSKNLGMPVIKSLNSEYHKKSHPDEKIERNYVTFTFNEISNLYNIDLSMCISVIGKGSHKCKDMFIPMSIFRFDKVIEKSIIRYIDSCTKANSKYDIEKIIYYGGK